MKAPRGSPSKGRSWNSIKEEPEVFLKEKEQLINDNNLNPTKKGLKEELKNLQLKNDSATHNIRKKIKSVSNSAMSDDEIAEEPTESNAGSDKENCVGEKTEISTLNKTNGHMACPEMDSKINELIQNMVFSAESDSESDRNSFLDSMAEEGEEDTPSDGSNDIIEVGELINTTESEISTDESYDSDSFIDDDGSHQLLSGEEYDLSIDDGKKKSRIIKLSSGSDVEIVPLEKIKKKKKIKKKRKSRIIRFPNSSDEETQDPTNHNESVNEKEDVINTSCDLSAIDKTEDIVIEDNSSSQNPTLSSTPNPGKTSNEKIVILENIKIHIPKKELNVYANLINSNTDSYASRGNEKFKEKPVEGQQASNALKSTEKDAAKVVDSNQTLVTKKKRRRKNKIKQTDSALDSSKNSTAESFGDNLDLVTEQKVIGSSPGLVTKTSKRRKMSKKQTAPVEGALNSPKNATTEIVCNGTKSSDSPGLVTEKKKRMKKSKKKVKSVDDALNIPTDHTTEGGCDSSELVTPQNLVSDSPGLVKRKKERMRKSKKKVRSVDNALNGPKNETTELVCNNSELVTQQNVSDSPGLVTEKKNISVESVDNTLNSPTDHTNSDLVTQQNVVADSPGLATEKEMESVDNALKSPDNGTAESVCSNTELVSQQNAIDGSPSLITENSRGKRKKSKRRTADKRNCNPYDEFKIEAKQTKSDEHREDRKTSKTKKRKRRHSSDSGLTKKQKIVVDTAEVKLNLSDEVCGEIAASKAEIQKQVTDDKLNAKQFALKDFKNAMLFNGTRIKRIKTKNFLQKQLKCRV